MKKRKLIQGGIAILMAIFVLALAGCPQGTEDPTDDPQIPPTGTLTIKYGKPEIKANSAKFVDPIWNGVASFPIEKVYENDTNMEFWDGLTKGIGRALWDENGVYVYVKVIDPTVNTSAGSAHERDSVELFINEAVDATNAIVKVPAGNGDKGGQYRVDADGAASGDPEPAVTAMTTLNKISGWHTDDGYIVIFQAPWRFKEQYPLKDLKKIGFDVQINACSDGSRDGVVVWHNNISQSYQNVTNYGEVTLDATGAPNFEVNAALPVISGQPVSKLYTPPLPATADALTVTAAASDGGTLLYQWYSNAADDYTGGTAISGETNASYTPPITAGGTTYYWVEVKNTKDGKTSAAVKSNRASIIVTATEVDYIERITTENGAFPVYKFTLPTGETYGNYTKITAEFKLDATNLALQARARVLGNYLESDFANGLIQYGSGANDKNGPYIINNIQGGDAALSGIGITAADTWTKVEFALTGNRHGSFSTANEPAGTATGPFYFAVGLSRGSSGNSITYMVKNITLESADGSKKVESAGAGVTPGFVFNENPDQLSRNVVVE